MVQEHIREKLETLPTRPGVYVFRGSAFAGGDAEVLYVGKARSLRSRVRSYFQPGTSDVRAFVQRLDRELSDIETFVTDSEREAALLENQLIKQHQPRYNVKLRDDKEFLSLRLDPDREWPRLEVVRRPRPDKARYFGPYHSATAARQTLRLVNRHFQLRTCTDAELKSRTRPCLQYQIRRCPGPCARDVDADVYGAQVQDVALFLDGRHDELTEKLQSKMSVAAEELEYEQAAVYRDQLKAVERARQAQRVASVSKLDQDVIGLHRQADQAEFAVLQLRSGRLQSVSTFDIDGIALPDDELVSSFVREWYERAPVPDEVLLPVEVEAIEAVAELLGEGRRTGERSRKNRRAVQVLCPQRGKKKKLLDLANDNATHAFQEKRRAAEDVKTRLAAVQERLRLPALPHVIECIDISHTGGDDTVAAVVCVEDAQPNKKRYRSYHVKSVRGGDDYGAMHEVLCRRLRRGREQEDGWQLPDLLVVDGGKGQLNVALAACKDVGVELPVVGLAKEKENPLGDKRVDRVYLPGQKNPIPVHSTPALQMLCLARDEAHRFSNRLRTKLGQRRKLRSGLDSVDGVGPKTRAKLLAKLGSLAAVREASVDELCAAGANRRQAEAIARAFASGVREEVSAQDVDEAIENAFVVEERSERSSTGPANDGTATS